MTAERSLATHQHVVGDPGTRFVLSPPLLRGDPGAETSAERRPLAVGYDYDAVDAALFDRPIEAGLERWAPLLPPLAGESLGAGATPTTRVPDLAEWAGLDAPVYVKHESRNPTWSHKDRLNRLTTSAALRADARGVVAASTGNHGASAAAHAARAGLPCVVFTVPGTYPAMEEFVRSYGAAVLQPTDHDALTDLVASLADRGFHPVTSTTETHTGHPYGPEGYKTIAYEAHAQVGTVPDAVFVPTGLGELVYGVWKGFRELDRLGVADGTPRMVACEPGPQAAVSEAIDRGEPLATVDAGESAAHSIGGAESTHRAYRAVVDSGGTAVPVPETTIEAAQDRLARAGLWQEFSAAAGAGGLRAADLDLDGPALVLGCSSGFKNGTDWSAPRVQGSIDAVENALLEQYDLDVRA